MDVKMDAGDVLVALSHSHFKAVMSEIQGHLKALAEISREFVFNFWYLRATMSWGYGMLGLQGARAGLQDARVWLWDAWVLGGLFFFFF